MLRLPLTVTALVLIVLIEGNRTGKAGFVATIVSTVPLPAETFVLGYYSGTGKIPDPN